LLARSFRVKAIAQYDSVASGSLDYLDSCRDGTGKVFEPIGNNEDLKKHLFKSHLF